MSGPRVLLAVLSERTSAKGNAYLAGWLGKARVVGFRGDDDPYGNPTWNLYVSEPEPREGAATGAVRTAEQPSGGAPRRPPVNSRGGRPATPAARNGVAEDGFDWERGDDVPL